MADSRAGRGAWLRAGAFLLLALAVPLLAACGVAGGTLSNVRASATEIVPGSHGTGNPPGVLEVRYTLGKDAQVTAQLQGAATATLLSESQSAGEHVVRFAGVVTATEKLSDATAVRRAVPPGEYTITISAEGASEAVRFKVGGVASQPPSIANLVLSPAAISPNGDAVDDVAEVTFRTEQTTTISVALVGVNDTPVMQFAPQEKGPGEQRVVVAGQDLAGNTLPDGEYTVAVTLEDRHGNRVVAGQPLKIEGGGAPSIAVLKVEISPTQITLGSTIVVSITVKNTGNVPLRTQGPGPGYTYTTNDSYSSIEANKWTDKPGLWRVGADWDGNTGGGPYRYPFRWGFGRTLMPGETVTTGGKVTILKQESTMWFYAGVLQEGVKIVFDRLGRTKVGVSF